MLMRSHSERRTYPGLSALMTRGSPVQTEMTSPRGSIFAPVPLSSPPVWVSQALANLEKGEQELQTLQERQQADVEEVNRQLDHAVIQAQREERRLLEKVEHDHREVQRHLDRVKRENAAAVRVGETLVDRQLRKMGQLKEQVQRWGSTSGGSNKNQLQRGVAELTQPWEISVSLKRVCFTPCCAPSEAFDFGKVDVQEDSLAYPVGVCGAQGQKCPLHSGEITLAKNTLVEVRKDPPPPGAGCGLGHGPAVDSKANSGKMRVVRKLRLSSSGGNEQGVKLPASKPLSPHQRSASESSQDEELDSLCSDSQDHLFLAIAPLSSQPESEGDDPDSVLSGTKRRSILKCPRKPRTLVVVSGEEPSAPPEGSSPDVDPVTSPGTRRGGGSLSGRGFSRTLSVSKSVHSTWTGGERPPSPMGSDDSSDTYTVNPSRHSSPSPERRRVASAATLPGTPQPPLVNGGKAERPGIRRSYRTCLSCVPSTSFDRGLQGPYETGRSPTSSDEQVSRPQSPVKRVVGGSFRVGRSLSMSAIEGGRSPHGEERGHSQFDWGGRGKAGPALKELEEDGVSHALDLGVLVKQFGRQGSGRTDFNLPSGLHATPRGQLFVVDCGNARIQVTDLQKNVVQQVSPAGTERSARICNYFDVAVNAKGLIAMTCAAERALLVFSRHGRLLRTFGGAAAGLTHEDLDAPRGVTVTRLDEFLVADLKRSTLTSLKLDPKTGSRLERTVVTGFHRPYLVAACLSTGLMAVSERGNETGRGPCIRVLEPGWNTVRVLGVCSGLGPVLSCPWGLCVDGDGDVIVADWSKQQHRVLLYPAQGVGWPLVQDNLSHPRGLALLPDGHVVVSDSMNHCIKIYRYK